MKQLKKFALVAAMLPMVAACSVVNLDDVSSMEIQNWPFAESLHKEYIDLAYTEQAETDWDDSNYFGQKSLDTAMAADEGSSLPGPQAISERVIPAEAMSDLEAANDSLMAGLADGRRTNPAAAARAQAMFDCWLQEQEENFQPDDIAACRAAFEAAMGELVAPAAAAAPAAEAQSMKTAGPFMVYFAHNSSSLDDAATSLVSTLAAHSFAKDEMGYIVLSGHADSSGNKAYNEALAEKRVMAVEEALMAAGVAAKVMASSYGEDRLASQTGDDMREMKNRRVELSLSR